MKLRSNWNFCTLVECLVDILNDFLKYVLPLCREDITHEAETEKIYRAYYSDKLGRSIIVMKPSYEVLLNLADSCLQEQRMVKE